MKKVPFLPIIISLSFCISCFKANKEERKVDKEPLENVKKKIKKSPVHYKNFKLIEAINNTQLAEKLEHKVKDLQFVSVVSTNTTETIEVIEGDSLFWEVLIEKKRIISYLLNHITDTTTTKFIVYPTIGHLSIKALCELIPTTGKEITNFVSQNYSKYDTSVGWYNCERFFDEAYSHKVILEKHLKKWYKKNKDKLVFKPCIKYIEGQRRNKRKIYHPLGGYYVLQQD